MFASYRHINTKIVFSIIQLQQWIQKCTQAVHPLLEIVLTWVSIHYSHHFPMLQNLKAMRSMFKIVWLLWNSTGTLILWARVTHIWVSELSIIGSDNGLSPGRRQAIIWTNVGILLIGPLGTNFSEILIKIVTFSYKKIHLKMSSGKWRPFHLGLNVLTDINTAEW